MPSKFELLREQETRITKQIGDTLSLVPAILGKERVIYASSPITTGKRMYDLFHANGVTSVTELNSINPKLFPQQIMQANIDDGRRFGDEIRTHEGRIAIVPGEFFGKGWAQEHYMSLWKQVIKRHAGEIRLNTDWQYSNGCAAEFLIGLEHGIPLVERYATTALSQKEGLVKVQAAIDFIGDLGVEPKPLFDIARDIDNFDSKTIIDLK